jgi:hypothetical protein
MSQRIDQEIRELRRAGRRLENASKEWEAAYREYLGAMSALSRKVAGRTSSQSHRQSNKTATRK